MPEDFELPPRLYHGTRSSVLPLLAKHGLMPRALSGASNWVQSVESREDAVYLTLAYALHYAQCCEAEGSPTLLEIDTSKLDATLFASDEDGVAQLKAGRAQAGANASLAEATEYWRERVHEVHPSVSLESLGNCTYFGVIPPEAVSRVLVLSQVDATRLTLQACDPVIVTMNYRLLGEKYRAFNAWLFEPMGPCPSSARDVEPPAARACLLREALDGAAFVNLAGAG